MAKRARAKSSAAASGHLRAVSIALGAVVLTGAAAFSIYRQWGGGAVQEIPLAEGCIRDKSGFRAVAGKPEFYVELTNACGVRARCTVHVNVSGSRGSKSDSGTLTLPAGTAGQETRIIWATPTAEAGGMASLSRKCVGM